MWRLTYIYIIYIYIYIIYIIYISYTPTFAKKKKHLPSQAKPPAHSLGTPPSVQRNGS